MICDVGLSPPRITPILLTLLTLATHSNESVTFHCTLRTVVLCFLSVPHQRAFSTITMTATSSTAFTDKFTKVNEFEYIRCNELERGQTYPILAIQSTPTKYSNSLLATIADPSQQKSDTVNLPKRYSKVFTSEELQPLQTHTLNLIYRGQREQTFLGTDSKLIRIHYIKKELI